MMDLNNQNKEIEYDDEFDKYAQVDFENLDNFYMIPKGKLPIFGD